ncbi:MAG: chromosomal replication initiator protein DnaA [Syntrophales bacterium]|nr:chromosomal replication initiator protein DnaA [Syntrophales bacterium]
MLTNSGDLNTVWNQALEIIKENLNSSNFETWIKPIRCIFIGDGIARLAVPNRFFKDWIVDHYLSLIQDTLCEVMGEDISVILEIVQSENYKRNLNSEGKDRDFSRSERVKRPSHNLNSNYSFERFVVGPSNQFAHAAALAVAENPAKTYNPLFIYGGVGLGKTHLLNAIGLRALSLYPDFNVVYISAEAFMNEMITCIRYDKMQHFRDKYRNIEYLLIDDIQFIAGKERTQEEFFHTFNSLHDSGKQIVVTCDKFPKDIPNLESRLRSRFEWGLIADIQPPETETKIAIIKKKAQENNVDIPDNVAYYIASHTESNIREIEGFLLRIMAYASLKRREIDIDLVKEVLKHVIRHHVKEEITVEEIVRIVASKMGVRLTDIRSPKKNKNIVLSRQIAMYLSRKLTDASFPDIGEKIGGRDHSTVIHACNKVEKLMEEDIKIRKVVGELEEIIKNKK